MSSTNQWIRNDFEEDGEICYFFHRNFGGGVAHVTISEDGTLVFEGFNRRVEIRNIGTKRESVKIINAADVVL